MRKQKKLEEAYFECMRRLYKESTPSADFDKLLEEAPKNEMGQKVIDFDSYIIDSNRFDEIVNEIIKEYKIKDKLYLDKFRFNIYLGASPRSSEI
jgi:hypothetical protein